MKTRFVAILAMLAIPAVMTLTGCGGDVCEDAAEVCGATSEGEGEGECTGAAECAAQCIVDADDCDFLNNADLAECIGGCA
jgi:hypothetical protein